MPPERVTAAGHVELLAFAPHGEVLPSADLVITHSGHGTVMAAAGAGVPMLCLPTGRDQPFVAGRVEALGLGVAIAPTSSPGDIAAAVAGMLAEPKWRAAAKAFAANVPRFGELERAAELVEQVA
jgi:UDP:flavonoid glycosyltransferase YjiC (YdhE family)